MLKVNVNPFCKYIDIDYSCYNFNHMVVRSASTLIQSVVISTKI